jgi:ATP-binding cassette, subfamily B, bacterial MsbA
MKTALRLYARLLSSIAPYKGWVALSILAMVVAAALEPLMPALLKPLIDESLIGKDPESLWQIPLYLMLVFVAKGIAEYGANVSSQWIAHRAVADLRQRVFEHMLVLPLSTHQAQTQGRMLSRVLYDIPQVGTALSTAWIIVIRDSLVILGLIGFLVYTAWELTLFIFVIAPVIAWLIRLASQHMRASNEAVQHSTGQMAGVLEEGLKGLREIRIFGAQDYEARRFSSASEALRAHTMKAVRVSALNVPLVQVLAALAVSLVIYVASSLSVNDRLSPGEFVAFVAAMSMLFEPIRRLTNINATIQSGLAGAQSLFELLDWPAEPQHPPAKGWKATGAITFDAVSFRYPGQEDWALDGFSLKVAPGQTVALVGASGSGKSTVIHLLAGFDRPEQGEIRLDERPIQTLALQDLRAQLAWVGQHVVLFDDTIAANMAYGRPDVPFERIEAAARAAQAWPFIAPLKEGLMTLVGPNGSRFSGGQRQRLAIARAFLKEAPLLVLDEATSALDSESESLVQDALHTLMTGRTTLVIAHRLSTIEKADLIVVMDKGRIIEQGAHAALLAQNGAYARFHRLQSGGMTGSESAADSKEKTPCTS